MSRRHFAVRPSLDETACGAEQEFQTTELDLVTCADCRRIVLQAEILGTAS